MPGDACRQALAAIARQDGPVSHPGLALHRYLAGHATQEEKRAGRRPEIELLRRAASSTAGPPYEAAFRRWRSTRDPRKGLSFSGEAAAALAIGLGNESPLEVGLTVHHTYGMPLLPGSALKGLCRRGALLLRQDGAVSETQFQALFGDTHTASHVVFWDAWYDPESVGARPFKRDVITVHHPAYYGIRGAGDWPTDFDDPNPVPFLVVRPGARFLFALDGPSREWLDFGEQLRRWSLEHLGAGGKTNAGYGVFRFEERRAEPRTAHEEATRAPVATSATRTQRWEGVLVRLDPPTGDVQAIFGAVKAVASRSERDKVLAALTDEQRSRLLEKGQPRRLKKANVEVEQLGNAWRLLRIEKSGE